MLLIKTLAAFCVGAAMLAGLQTAGLLSLQRYLKSEQAKAGVPVVASGPTFNANFKPIGPFLQKTGAIDTKKYEALGVQSAQRRIDMQIRAAQNAVPLPPRVPGMPRR
jgi:hypothetical protein